MKMLHDNAILLVIFSAAESDSYHALCELYVLTEKLVDRGVRK
jgi:hypothetical protein